MYERSTVIIYSQFKPNLLPVQQKITVNICFLALYWCEPHISTGNVLQYEESQSPLHNLEQAAVHYASAIRLSSRDARLHFLLGHVLEEQYYATGMYGLQRKVVERLALHWYAVRFCSDDYL